MRMRRVGAIAVVGLVLALTACGSSSDGSSDSEASVTTTETAATAAGDQVSVTASGAASGSFDTVTNCTTSGGAGNGLLVQLAGTLDGSAATLTLDQDTFTPDVYVYPTASPPPSATELRSDITFDQDADKGSWQFFAVEPAGHEGESGGSIGIVETGDALDFTMDVKYGTTDASGPLTVKGEFTCTQTP